MSNNSISSILQIINKSSEKIKKEIFETYYQKTNQITTEEISIINKSHLFEGLNLYTLVFRHCTVNDNLIKRKNEKMLFYNFKRTLKNFFEFAYKTIILNKEEENNNENEEDKEYCLISDFLKIVNISKIYINWNINVYQYLDRFYLINTNSLSLAEVSLYFLVEFFYLPLKTALFNKVMKIINSHRDFPQVNSEKINSLQSFFEVLYEIDSENARFEYNKSINKYEWKGRPQNRLVQDWIEYFISSTSIYLLNKGNDLLETCECEEYISKSINFINEENMRKEVYLRKERFYLLDDKINSILVEDKGSVVLNKNNSFIRILSEGNTKVLSDIYMLFQRSTSCLKNLSDSIIPFIKERGENIYKNIEIAKDPTSKYLN